MDTELSIIIVNYNGQKYLQACFDSLYEKLQGINFEIIVIDNNSSDQSVGFIREHYPNVVLLESKINHGFGKGNNEAVRKAKGNYVLLFNNDTILLDNIAPVLDFLKRDMTIGVIGINMLNGDGNYLPASGNFPNAGNMFRMKKLLEKEGDFKTGVFSEESYEVDWLGGSFLLMPKKLYQEIGGFDEDYFLYVEDVDICKKIAEKGYKRVFMPGYKYLHFVGFNKSKNPMLVAGYEIYIRKHFRGLEKIRVSMALQLNKCVKMLKSFLRLN